MRHLKSYKLFESDDFSKPLTVKKGTEMFHSTGEDFDEKSLHGGGYDGIVWTTDTSAISQTYIPQSGASVYISAEHISAPSDDPMVQDIQKKIGIVFDYSEVEWDKHRASSWRPAPVFADIDNDDVTSWFDKQKKKNDYVTDKIKSELGYVPKEMGYHDNDLNYTFVVKTTGNTALPSDYRMKGRLFVITPKEDLSVYDMTYGGKIEGDLTDPDYKKVGFFDKLKKSGYDGVKINDWTQTEEFGNFGHTSIGLFKDGLKKCDIEVIPDVTYPKEFERMADERDWDSEEYKAYKKIIKVKS